MKAVFAGLLLAACNAFAGPVAYVPNERSGTISMIDTTTDRVVAEIKAGAKPRGIAVSPDGKRLFVSDQPANALLVIDIPQRKIERSIPLGESPEGVSLSRDGRLVAAAAGLARP